MKRHYCTYCKAKRNESFMTEVYYKFLHKKAWVCSSHLSAEADVMQIIKSKNKGNFIEFFSGSKHISNCVKEYGYNAYTVDNNLQLCPDLCKDIRKVKLTELPGNVEIIWASIPCTVYSILNLSNHWEKIPVSWRNYYYVPKSKEAKEAIQILEKTLWLISRINPMYFFIENPRGALRHMPQLKSIPFRHTVSYSDYGFDYYKPTDIFTNMPNLKLKQISSSVGKTFPRSVATLKNNYERSKVPGALIHSIFKQI